MGEIEKLIKKGESKTVEFKATLPSGNSLAKTIVSFSNMAGGKIIIGVEDKTGRIIGIDDNEALDFPDKISNIVHSRCYPAVVPEIYLENIKDKKVLVVDVYSGPSKPYYLKNKGRREGVYIRVGATNKPADQEMILELERQRRNVSFDEEIDYEKNEAIIDIQRLYDDFQKYTGRKLEFNNLLTLRILKEENKKYYPTIGGLLLAGNEDYFEYARIKCARFKGNDVGEFIDQKEFAGPLYEQVENSMKFANVYIARAGKVEFLQRIDTYEVPLEAVREALVNAVVHRDYSISGSDIKFAIFDDRIEITSPGNLPKTLTIEDILTGRSEIRNKIIARFFKELNLVEQWGTGIRKILHFCKTAGLKQPEFMERGLSFKVVFYKAKSTKGFIQTGSPGSVLKSIPKSRPKSVPKNIPKSALKILEIIREEPAVTITKLADILEISVSGVKKNISILKRNNLLKRIGSPKGGCWEVPDEDNTNKE